MDPSQKQFRASTAENSPLLAPEEHAWIEQLTGKTLTNEEAQTLLRAAKLTASWEDIYGKKGRP